MSLITPHGATIRWGTANIEVTSVSLSGSAEEIDITSMSSRTRQDPQNSSRWFITRDYDVGFNGAVPDVSVEFFARAGGISLMDVGSKRTFFAQFFQEPVGNFAGPLAFEISGVEAILTQLQLTGSAGEYVRGSATFKLSGL
jgi:hypothetical protein